MGQMENEYGRIIAYERKRTQLSAEKLCEGICSRVYLQRIEKGERFCEKILADVLLQRMGVASEKFSYVLNVQEQEKIKWKEKMVDLVNRNQKKEAMYEMEQCKKQTKENILYLQFCMLAETVLGWKNGEDREKLLENIQKAWNLTRKGKNILRVQGLCLSYFEFSLAMLYVRLLEGNREEEEIMMYYQKLLLYLEKHVEEPDRVKWYSQIAVRVVPLLKKNNNSKQAWKITIQAIQLLQRQACMFHLSELLRLYQEFLEEKYGKIRASMPQKVQKELFDIDGICNSLEWCYQEYKEKQKEWIWDISFGVGELYLCQDIIRGRRNGMGMSQQELAEGICSPVTISRIECGKTYPKRKELVKLLERVKWSGETCTLTAQIGNPEYHQTTSKISNLTYLGNYQEVEKLLEELEKKIPEKNVFAQQYFLNNINITQFALGKKSKEEYYISAEKALYLTVPRLEKEKWKKWHFTRAEVMCINAMSYGCEEVGKEEEVIELLERIKEFYERQGMSLEHYQAGYELTVRNLGSLLGNLGKYKESILLADITINVAFCSEDIGIMSIALYDKGWGMEYLWKEEVFYKQESLNYVKASYYLNLFLDRKISYEFIREHIKEIYGKDIYGCKGIRGISE